MRRAEGLHVADRRLRYRISFEVWRLGRLFLYSKSFYIHGRKQKTKSKI